MKYQISRTAIETKSPHHMQLYIYTTWRFIFSKMNKFNLGFWFRCIDDIFFIWTANENELDNFLKRPNNFHPNLKFTHGSSREEINFLDITVRVNLDQFMTDLYCDHTDGHHYLHFESCHPSHTKSSIFFVRL